MKPYRVNNLTREQKSALREYLTTHLLKQEDGKLKYDDNVNEKDRAKTLNVSYAQLQHYRIENFGEITQEKPQWATKRSSDIAEIKLRLDLLEEVPQCKEALATEFAKLKAEVSVIREALTSRGWKLL